MPSFGLSQLLIQASKDDQVKFDEQLEQLCQTLLKTGLTFETEWKCTINIFDKSQAVGFPDKNEEIRQIFTLEDTYYPSLVHSVSVLASKSYQTSTCKTGMVEFLKNSSFYEWKKQKIDISGHIFRQGDIRVKVGILSVNYPKLVVI